jgi:hypothetical protein
MAPPRRTETALFQAKPQSSGSSVGGIHGIQWLKYAQITQHQDGFDQVQNSKGIFSVKHGMHYDAL